MEPIAIIGMGCRLPRAENPESFWRLLVNGVDAITEIPSDRWDLKDFYDDNPETPGKMNSRWGGFLEGIDRFDANFFRISPREARQMDPQQRLLLEVAWEALEDAGQAADQLSGAPVGVFIGVMNAEFGGIHLQKYPRVNTQLGAGSSAGIAASRLSYFLNFQGPSLVVDTLCSSSMVAVHLACQSIWNGESTPLAIAGGVNVVLSPTMSIFYAKSGLTAPDGRCKTFDARANGIVRGEGVGVVVLKPLERALADGDPIYCVIRGSAVNQDGRSNGLTAPNGWAQIALLKDAYRRAGVSPGRVQYVEAHGTGTPIGDPIELKALGSVLATDRPDGNRCSVGSVKTNIGHLESAAAIASLIKTALVLKHRTLVPSLHFESPNPYIPFDELPLRVQQAVEPWPPETTSMIAGVSSFGLGGTNAHVVLESFQPSVEFDETHRSSRNEPHILTLSARSAGALEALARSYSQFGSPDVTKDTTTEMSGSVLSLHDLCYTASTRRSHHDFRLAILARSMSEVTGRLNDFLEGNSAPGLFKGRKGAGEQPGLVFMFGGQGSQWAGMGLELLENQPVFRTAVEQCDDLLSRQAGWCLIDELRVDAAHSRMHETVIAQPAIFAVQVGLAALWSSWGINPDAVIGHSVGEVAAAYVAGALSLQDAVTIIFQRGRLMQRASGKGKMLAVKAARSGLESLLEGYEQRISVAAVNGPTSFTLSGDPTAIEELFESLPDRGGVGKVLSGEYAFHSPQMESLQEELTAALSHIVPRSASIPIFSTLTGQSSGRHEFDASYWARQIREPVLFAPALNELIGRGFRFFVELSPHPVLTGAVTRCLRQQGHQGSALPSLKQGTTARATMLNSLSALFVQGFDVKWSALYPKGGRCVQLPAYPWQKERLWLESTHVESATTQRPRASLDDAADTSHPVLSRFLRSAAQPDTCFWQGELGPGLFAYLKEHRINGDVVLPASAYLEMALSAASAISKDAHPVLKSAQFQRPLSLEADEGRTIQLVISGQPDGKSRFQIFSLASAVKQARADTWTLHVEGLIDLQEQAAAHAERLRPEVIRERCGQAADASKFYESLRSCGLDYGESFQAIVDLRRRDGEAFARIRTPDPITSEAGDYQIHPALLDACFHLLLSALSESPSSLYLPMSLDSLRVLARPEGEFYAHAVLRGADGLAEGSVTGDVTAFDESGRVLVEARGLRGRRLAGERSCRVEENMWDWLTELTWQREALEVSSSNIADPAQPGCWLIFSDKAGIGERLRELLSKQGEASALVFQGDSYFSMAQGQYRINGSNPDDFRRLLEEVFSSSELPCRNAIHLWSLDAVSGVDTTLSTLRKAQESGCISILHFLQALDRTDWKHTPRLWLVTRNAQAVNGDREAIEVAQSSLWGLGKTISQELPQLHCAMLDLTEGDSSQAAEIILREASAAEGQSQVAWRQQERYAAHLTRSPGKARDDSLEYSMLRPDSTYLITGGLGGLGLRVAEWMVNKGVRHLVLLGRNRPSPAARESLERLTRSGAEVRVMLANAASEDQIARVLAGIRQEMPGLRGIIHAAGVLSDGALLRADQDSFAKVMEPKILGAWNLHIQTLDLPIDFFVMFSSLASLLGSKGQGNYAAANAFLDALSHYRHQLGRAALSINWGPWSEVGMAAGLGERMALAGLKSLTPEEGLEVLERLIREKFVQVGVIPRTGAGFSESWPALAETAFAKRERPPEQRSFIRQLEESPGADRWPLLVRHIQAEAGSVLGYVDSLDVDIRQNLFDIGMDSLMAVELAGTIQTSLEQSFSLSLVFENPSIEEIARYLADNVLSLEVTRQNRAQA